MSMVTRAELEGIRHQAQRRERALVALVLQMLRRERWLRARFGELQGRVRDLDRKPPDPAPPWPELEVPAELRELVDESKET